VTTDDKARAEIDRAVAMGATGGHVYDRWVSPLLAERDKARDAHLRLARALDISQPATWDEMIGAARSACRERDRLHEEQQDLQRDRLRVHADNRLLLWLHAEAQWQRDQLKAAVSLIESWYASAAKAAHQIVRLPGVAAQPAEPPDQTIPSSPALRARVQTDEWCHAGHAPAAQPAERTVKSSEPQVSDDSCGSPAKNAGSLGCGASVTPAPGPAAQPEPQDEPVRERDVVDFLLARYEAPRTAHCTGISSDALAYYAAGGRAEPKFPGEYPYDRGDLAACEKTYDMAPAALQERMKPVLDKFRDSVLGRPASSGTATEPRCPACAHPMPDPGECENCAANGGTAHDPKEHTDGE
jgi:hypothetical protein